MVGEIKGSFKILIYFSYSLSTMLLEGMLHNLEYRRLDTITIGKTYDDLYAHIKEDVGYGMIEHEDFIIPLLDQLITFDESENMNYYSRIWMEKL